MNLQSFESERSAVSTPFGEASYVDVGEGPTALFVHGVFLNAFLWRNLIEGLRTERRCIAVDLPAHGNTLVATGYDFSLASHAAFLEAFCDSLGLDRIDLVGNDSGGAVAQVFAAHQAERLRTLTLTNCDTHDNLPPPAFGQVVELAAAGSLAPLVPEMLANLSLARSDIGLGVGYERPDAVTDETIRAYLEPLAATPAAGRELERFITALDAADLLAVEPRLQQLHVPTLVVWGTGDVFFPVAWAYWLKDNLPGVTEVIELDGAKLFFPDERAADLLPHLQRHFTAHADGRGTDTSAAAPPVP